MERRRRVPRQPAGWDGKYCVEGEEGEAWQECRVLDISIIGLGAELFGLSSSPGELLGKCLTVEAYTPAGAALSIRAKGEVRNLGVGPTCGIRVGLEFVELSSAERSILDALVLMEALW